MLKPIQGTEEEQGLMFVIEGKEWNLYRGDSVLEDIKDTFINAETIKDGDKENYKYIGLTRAGSTERIVTLAVTYNDRFIIEQSAVVGHCIYPISPKDLSNMIYELINHYSKLDYKIIHRRQTI